MPGSEFILVDAVPDSQVAKVWIVGKSDVVAQGRLAHAPQRHQQADRWGPRLEVPEGTPILADAERIGITHDGTSELRAGQQAGILHLFPIKVA